ncbi:ATP-binding protein [Phaeodactylibacter xiamenensis]|mgnify:CR=1 FL=1|jgi:signal transduction histidine kinase|uniref:ATP-binding protein n=1 Tax=Phaeodactylibacter xiamenensis TaxID=1524460 RepID=UPI003BABE55E
MGKKPFKVSARTARLIGRENVSNADGALIELVKNCYDADSPACILYFDIVHDSIPEALDAETYAKYAEATTQKDEEGNESSFFELAYLYNDEENEFLLNEEASSDVISELEVFLKSKNSLFIIDSGEGMTEEVIDNHWMTIGTNNKLTDVFTKSGRVKAGAKGIGRFALDRLGSYCHMITLPKGETTGFDWRVDWEDFEKEGAVIGEIAADFEPIRRLDYQSKVVNLTRSPRVLKAIEKSKADFKQGTTLHIRELRDWWTERDLNNLFDNLQNLSPPGGKHKFHIEMLSKTHPKSYGKVDNDEYADYDYKVFAKVNSDKTINIEVYRNEFQVNKIDKDLFKRRAMKSDPYDFSTFKKGHYGISTSVNELLPWLENSTYSDEADRLKEFDFTFYFIKQSAKPKDKERFAYRNFNRNERSDWFRKFGGIKVFRDNFRVRPYGETNNTAFDWLLLGDRQSRSPAGITKKGAGWRVAPNQVAGVVNISRLANLSFEDKSSREGFQENDTFFIFKQLLIEIIHQFELDRHEVMREMDALNREKEKEEEAKRKAEELIEKDNEEEETKDDEEPTSDSSEENDDGPEEEDEEDLKGERDTFKTAFSAVKTELEDAQEQVRLLSALATTGLIMTSFAHEFPSFKNRLVRNANNLERALDKELDRDELEERLPAKNNPFNHIAKLKKAHVGIAHWLDLALAAVRKDKRSAKPINIKTYLDEFKDVVWKEVLKSRKTNLTITSQTEEELQLKGFIVHVDSIFHNLLINSFDAFDRKGFAGKREIKIEVDVVHEEDDGQHYIDIDYSDSGPGLSKNIKNSYKILERGYTTKVDNNDEAVGTGLGMWLLNEAVAYYGGLIDIPTPEKGFQIRIRIPHSKI